MTDNPTLPLFTPELAKLPLKDRVVVEAAELNNVVVPSAAVAPDGSVYVAFEDNTSASSGARAWRASPARCATAR